MNPSKPNYYDILGVQIDSRPEEIKKAYKELALKWHPEKNPKNILIAKQKFLDILTAFTVLNDQEKREDYDLNGQEYEPNIDIEGFLIWFDFEAMLTMMKGDFESMFSSMFVQSERKCNLQKAQRVKQKEEGNTMNVRFQEDSKEISANYEEEEWETDEEDNDERSKISKAQHGMDKNLKTQIQEEAIEEVQEFDDEEDDNNILHVIENEQQQEGDLLQDDKVEYNEDDLEDFSDESIQDDNYPSDHFEENEDEENDEFMFESAFIIPLFIEQHVKETQPKQFTCAFDKKLLKEVNLMQHFQEDHKEEFQQWLESEDRKNFNKGKK